MEIEKIKEKIKNDPEFAFRALSEELRSNEEIVLYAVSLYHINLFYANKKFIKDEEFMLKAIKIDYASLEFADESLYYDRDFILKVVAMEPGSYVLIPDELYGDKEIRKLAGDNVRYIDDYRD